MVSGATVMQKKPKKGNFCRAVLFSDDDLQGRVLYMHHYLFPTGAPPESVSFCM